MREPNHESPENSGRFTTSTASIVESAVEAQVQRTLDLQNSFGKLIAANPDITNQQLGSWLTWLESRCLDIQAWKDSASMCA